jgi:amino acid transporter
LVFVGVAFFIPYGLLSTELGTAFPLEGGPYVGVKLAFGRFVAALTALLYWISNPLWLGGTLTITDVAAFDAFFTPLGPVRRYVFALLVIWAGGCGDSLFLRCRQARVALGRHRVRHGRTRRAARRTRSRTRRRRRAVRRNPV